MLLLCLMCIVYGTYLSFLFIFICLLECSGSGGDVRMLVLVSAERFYADLNKKTELSSLKTLGGIKSGSLKMIFWEFSCQTVYAAT